MREWSEVGKTSNGLFIGAFVVLPGESRHKWMYGETAGDK